jgi:hypothetical protein
MRYPERRRGDGDRDGADRHCDGEPGAISRRARVPLGAPFSTPALNEEWRPSRHVLCPFTDLMSLRCGALPNGEDLHRPLFVEIAPQ